MLILGKQNLAENKKTRIQNILVNLLSSQRQKNIVRTSNLNCSPKKDPDHSVWETKALIFIDAYKPILANPKTKLSVSTIEISGCS